MTRLRYHQTWHRWRVLASETGGWVAIPPGQEDHDWSASDLGTVMDLVCSEITYATRETCS